MISGSERFRSAAFIGSTATRNSGNLAPITATSPIPGTPSRRVLRSYSAISRISRSETESSFAVSAISIISPVTETRGEISACASSGSASLMRERRSNTSNLARVRSAFQSKSTQTNDNPPLELERTLVTPGIPLTADSIGIVTSSVTSSAVSPPASVRMVTLGTEMSGKTSTLRVWKILNPAKAAKRNAAIIVLGLCTAKLNIRFISYFIALDKVNF